MLKNISRDLSNFQCCQKLTFFLLVPNTDNLHMMKFFLEFYYIWWTVGKSFYLIAITLFSCLFKSFLKRSLKPKNWNVMKNTYINLYYITWLHHTISNHRFYTFVHCSYIYSFLRKTFIQRVTSILDPIFPCCSGVKFVFSKKATKIEEIFTVDLTLTTKCQIHSEDFVNFCCLLKNHELYKITC